MTVWTVMWLHTLVFGKKRYLKFTWSHFCNEQVKTARVSATLRFCGLVNQSEQRHLVAIGHKCKHCSTKHHWICKTKDHCGLAANRTATFLWQQTRNLNLDGNSHNHELLSVTKNESLIALISSETPYKYECNVSNKHLNTSATPVCHMACVPHQKWSVHVCKCVCCVMEKEVTADTITPIFACLKKVFCLF